MIATQNAMKVDVANTGRLRKRSSLFAFTCFLAFVLLASTCLLSGCVSASVKGHLANTIDNVLAAHNVLKVNTYDQVDVPDYAGRPSVEINGNVPFFLESDYLREPFEMYSAFDSLGRCGQAFAVIGPETMPMAKRGSIGMIRPSGWQIAEYDWIDGKYLFNRCHLIAYSLAGENDNPYNLITGTRALNASGMLPYEERVAMYVDDTGNHVLYRVTPVFEGDNLVASGVLMEAESIEDKGAGIRFCVWCYNVEPGVVIDYATGNNRAGDPQSESYGESSGEPPAVAASPPESASEGAVEDASEDGAEVQSDNGADPQSETYVLNTNTHRFHYPYCSSVSAMKEKNKQVYEGTREELIEQGYQPCGVCSP